MKRLLTIAALATPLTACMIGQDEPGNSDEDIIGGTHDSGDPSVVQIRYTLQVGINLYTAQCTGTVIASKIVLTAGHCANGWNYQYNTSAYANPFDPNGAGWLNAAFAFKHPQFTGDPANGGHDVAVIVLNSPSGLPASPLGAAPAVGATVRAVGYGLMTPGTGGGASGDKQEKSFPVSAISAREFVAGPNDTCHGDSGGPVFDTSGAVVGTTSYGDNVDCNGNDHFMRVDDNRAWIAQQIAAFNY